MPPAIAPAKIAQLIKGGSLAWIHEDFPKVRDFAWQGRWRCIYCQQVGDS